MSGQDGTCLTSQCLAFCQALASQGQDIKLSIKIGNHFNFSLDTKVKNPAPVARKQKSPPTKRRNAKRRTDFIASKETDTTYAESTTEVVEVAKVKVETSASNPIISTLETKMPYVIPSRRLLSNETENKILDEKKEALETPATSKLSNKEKLVPCTHCRYRSKTEEERRVHLKETHKNLTERQMKQLEEDTRSVQESLRKFKLQKANKASSCQGTSGRKK